MEINIKIVRADNLKPFRYFEKYLPLISPERQKRIERTKFEKDKINSLFAELLIRSEASQELGVKFCDISFIYGEHGKPSIAGREGYHFSVSHSGNIIAFASSQIPVGIDAERESRENIKIAKRFFTANEYETIMCSPERAADFCRVWTSKEAYVKMLGTGLSTSFSSFDVLDGSNGCRFYTRRIPDGYTVTACTEDGEHNCIFRSMTTEEFMAAVQNCQ